MHILPTSWNLVQGSPVSILSPQHSWFVLLCEICAHTYNSKDIHHIHVATGSNIQLVFQTMSFLNVTSPLPLKNVLMSLFYWTTYQFFLFLNEQWSGSFSITVSWTFLPMVGSLRNMKALISVWKPVFGALYLSWTVWNERKIWCISTLFLLHHSQLHTVVALLAHTFINMCRNKITVMTYWRNINNKNFILFLFLLINFRQN